MKTNKLPVSAWSRAKPGTGDPNLPPSNGKAGERHPVTAVSAQETIETVLTVIITGNYELKRALTGVLSFSPPPARKTVTGSIQHGQCGLKDIKPLLSSHQLTVTFEPDHIPLLKAGESQEVKAYVKGTAKHWLGLCGRADCSHTGNLPADFRVSVKPPLVGNCLFSHYYPLAVGLYKLSGIRETIMMAEEIIRTENLTKCYGDFKAVDGLNLEIKEGEIFCLLGSNGAGNYYYFDAAGTDGTIPRGLIATMTVPESLWR